MFFGLLGATTVVADGCELPIESAMVRGLLAILMLNSNQFVPLDRIAALLWDAPPQSMNANVRKYASLLRRILGRVSVGFDGRLESRRNTGYRLVASTHEMDATRFVEAARRGQAHLDAGDFPAAFRALQTALALWRGAAGQDLPPHSAIARQAQALNDERLVVANNLIDARLVLGDTAGIVVELRATVATHPLNERAWAQLIRAIHATGNPAAALATYSEARTTIRQALGIEPSTNLQALHRAVLNGDDIAMDRHASTRP